MFIKFKEGHHILYASIVPGDRISFTFRNDYSPSRQLDKNYYWKDLLPAREKRIEALVSEIEAKVEEIRQLL